MRFSATVAFVAFALSVGFARLGNAQTPKVAIKVKDVGVDEFAFSADGKQLATGFKNNLQIVSVEDGKVLKTLTASLRQICCVAYSPDGKSVAVGDFLAGNIQVWRFDTDRKWVGVTGGGFVHCVRFSPDSSQLLSGDSEGSVVFWDASLGRKQKTLFAHKTAVCSVEFSADGDRLLTSSSKNGGTLKVWKVEDLSNVQSITYEERLLPSIRPRAAAFCGGDTQIAAIFDNLTVNIFDIESGKAAKEFKIAKDVNAPFLNCVAISPSGEYLVAGCSGKIVMIWNLKTGKKVRQFVAAESNGRDPINSVAFSPEGKYLATADGDVFNPGGVKIWEFRPLLDE